MQRPSVVTLLAAVAGGAAIAAAASLLAPGPAGAAPVKGDDPAWVVTNYLDHRLFQSAVPDYPYVCATGIDWSPAGVTVPGGPPLPLAGNVVLDIRSYAPATIKVSEARNHTYRVVSVGTAGYERAETRNFILAPSPGGFCIGDIR